MIKIQRATLTDLWQIDAIFRQSLPQVTDAERHFAITRQAGVFVAKIERTVFGFYVAWITPSHSSVWLDYLAVSPSLSRQGVASAMLLHCEEEAQALGIGKIELSLHLHNLPARALYAKYGFEDDALTSHEDKILNKQKMRKELKQLASPRRSSALAPFEARSPKNVQGFLYISCARVILKLAAFFPITH